MDTQKIHQIYETSSFLQSVVEALSSVCNPVYLKGSAILIEHDFAPQIWRPMGDFDMLVEKRNLGTAISSIKGLGYETAADDDYLPRLMNHFTKSSQDTALRDINDLVKKKILIKGASSGRSTHYILIPL